MIERMTEWRHKLWILVLAVWIAYSAAVVVGGIVLAVIAAAHWAGM